MASKIKKGGISNAKNIEVNNFQHPVFCFKYLHKDFNLENCNDKEATQLIKQIVNISQLKWQDLQLSSRHGLGTEKINISSLKINLPAEITEDVINASNGLLAFRFDGKKPFVGIRNRFIFHVLAIDSKFTLYDH